MKLFVVNFHYSIFVRAKDEEDAQDKAEDKFIELNPEWRDMAIDVEEVPSKHKKNLGF